MIDVRAIAMGLALLLTVSLTQAQEQDAAAAEVLFREGQTLFEAGRAEEACPKFAASYKLAGGLGTLANLARCYETVGKNASAWALWVDLAALAARAGQRDREKIANTHIAELEPKLSRLTITVPKPVAGLEVLRDDTLLDGAIYGVAVAVDAGKHHIVARAPGYETWETEITVGDAGAPAAVVVPALVEVVVVPDPTPPPPPEEVKPAPRLAAPIDPPFPALLFAGGVTTTVGVIGLAVAAVFTASAASDWDAADCGNGTCPTEERQGLSEDANKSADLATGFVVAGGLVTAAGAILMIVGALDDEQAQLDARGLLIRF